MSDIGRKLASELSVSVDSVPFGKAGVRVVLEGYLGLPSFTVSPAAARAFADKLMRVADEAEKVSL